MDGEGCFRVINQARNGKFYGHATIMLSQSGENGLALLTEIQEQYGGRVYQHLKVGQHKATKPAYKLYWNKADAIILLEKLIPYLRLKQQDAQIVYDYLTRNHASK
jgi:hypothetical protein